MILKPRFDVVPHGVKKNVDENGATTFNAVFRMVIDFNDPVNPITEICKTDWETIRDHLNNRVWTYDFQSPSIIFKEFEKGNQTTGKKILFKFKNFEGKEVKKTDDESFGFGIEYIRQGTEQDVMTKLFDGNYKLDVTVGTGENSKEVRKDVFISWQPDVERQSEMRYFTPSGNGPIKKSSMGFETNTVADDFESGNDAFSINKRQRKEAVSDYKGILFGASKAVSKFTEASVIKKFSETTGDRVRLDLKSIHAIILDEPELALTRFGLVREFEIPISEIKNLVQDIDDNYEIKYKININAKDSAESYLLKKDSNRYFHGNQQLVFDPTEFEEVFVNFSDPYNNYLNSIDQKVSHPDGMYMLAKYKIVNESDSNTKEIDPFDKEWLKGFNVAIRPDQAGQKLYSLSYHRKYYEVKKRSRLRIDTYSIPTSGNLDPQAELVILNDINEIEQVKSNVLFAWRGDNLIVNRNKSNGLNKYDDVNIEADSDDSLEGDFLSKYFFTSREELIKSTQKELRAGENYDFILRTVGPTEHCLPIKAELTPDEQTYLLTLEDYLGLNIANTVFAKEAFRVETVKQIPIKAPQIVGPKKYSHSGSEFTDHTSNLVVNKEQNELYEVRYLYPPEIKFEDFRFLGYLDQNKLIKPGEDISDFVDNCIYYENRVPKRPPKIERSIKKIDYLADPRAKYTCYCPADLFTLSIFKNPWVDNSYEICDSHPYFKDTYINSITATTNNAGDNSIQVLKRGEDPKYVGGLKKVPLGSYFFKIMSSNKKNISLEESNLYNGSEVRVSFIDKPTAPTISNIGDLKEFAERKKVAGQEEFWFSEIEIQNDTPTWKSVKYLEESKVLKLQHEDLGDLMDEYKKNSNSILTDLLKNEFPYDIFLQKDGDVNGEDLKTTLYPKSVSLKFKMDEAFKPRSNSSENKTLEQYFFKFSLNEKFKILAELTSNGLILKAQGKSLKEIGWIELKAGTEIIAVFDQPKNTFVLFPDTENSFELEELISPEISIRDIEVSDEVLQLLNFSPLSAALSFEKSKEHVFIVNQRDTHAHEKKIKLFASSAFQAFYPKGKGRTLKLEIDLGTPGTDFNIFVPNNGIPEIPILESEILLVRNLNQKWTNNDYKQSSLEQVVRLTVQEDFMKEGRNRLGIILKKVKGTNSNPSDFGEDITKLSHHLEVDWSNFNLEDIIEDRTANMPSQHFRKYFDRNDVGYYEIDGEVYKVLRCKPFYNTELKKWQVLLSFNIRKSETLFLKIAAIKLCQGHSLEVLNDEFNTLNDPTGTNWSGISNIVQLPLYRTKRTVIERKGKLDGHMGYKIYDESNSSYKKKIYFIMVKDNNNEELMNLHWDPESSKANLDSFSEFKFMKGGSELSEKGKILMASNLEVVIYTSLQAKSIQVLEFEIHNNANSTKDISSSIVSSDEQKPIGQELINSKSKNTDLIIPRPEPRKGQGANFINGIFRSESFLIKYDFPKPEFITDNPLYDIPGIRLINASEFSL